MPASPLTIDARSSGLMKRIRNRRVYVYRIDCGDGTPDWMIVFRSWWPPKPGERKRDGRVVTKLRLSNEAALAMAGMVAQLSQRGGLVA